MAFVVSRPAGRFEIRESVHTPNGPRARSLVSFKTLTPRTLQTAAARAQRPFETQAVLSSGRRAGAPIDLLGSESRESERFSAHEFVAASRRMAAITAANGTKGIGGASERADPGAALMELLAFADAVKRSRPQPPRSELEFPVLARLRERRAHQAPAQSLGSA